MTSPEISEDAATMACSAAPEYKKRVTKILNTRGNHQCADCCAADPQWASRLILDQGSVAVVICEQCAVYHFIELGERMCVVKFLPFYHEWSHRELDILEQTGNSVCKSIYEAKLTAYDYTYWQQGLVCPKEEKKRQAKFVRKKYRESEFRDELALDRVLEEMKLRKQEVANSLGGKPEKRRSRRRSDKEDSLRSRKSVTSSSGLERRSASGSNLNHFVTRRSSNNNWSTDPALGRRSSSGSNLGPLISRANENSRRSGRRASNGNNLSLSLHKGERRKSTGHSVLQSLKPNSRRASWTELPPLEAAPPEEEQYIIRHSPNQVPSDSHTTTGACDKDDPFGLKDTLSKMESTRSLESVKSVVSLASTISGGTGFSDCSYQDDFNRDLSTSRDEQKVSFVKRRRHSLAHLESVFEDEDDFQESDSGGSLQHQASSDLDVSDTESVSSSQDFNEPVQKEDQLQEEEPPQTRQPSMSSRGTRGSQPTKRRSIRQNPPRRVRRGSRKTYYKNSNNQSETTDLKRADTAPIPRSGSAGGSSGSSPPLKRAGTAPTSTKREPTKTTWVGAPLRLDDPQSLQRSGTAPVAKRRSSSDMAPLKRSDTAPTNTAASRKTRSSSRVSEDQKSKEKSSRDAARTSRRSRQ